MKARSKETIPPSLTQGKFYTVTQHPQWSDCWLVVGDNGKQLDFYKFRFEEPLTDLQEKEEELEQAKQKVAQLQKEIEELKAPKVGQRYSHRTGDKYVVAKLEGSFSLVCYEGLEAGTIYGTAKSVEKVFFGNDCCFKLIGE